MVGQVARRKNRRAKVPVPDRLTKNILGHRIGVAFELVTVAVANAYLERNSGNRHLRPGVVERFARDMSKGRWKFTNQTIGFDVDGNIIDGQHRLSAIVQSGEAQWFLVVRGIVAENGIGIDCGIRRTPKDGAPARGMEMNNREQACARTMMRAGEGKQLTRTNAEVLDFFHDHGDVIRDATRLLSPKHTGISTASVDAAFARALYHADVNHLTRAAILLLKGMSPDKTVRDGDVTMISLRDHLMRQSKIKGYSGSPLQMLTLRRVVYALRCFLDGRDMEAIRPPKDLEMFPYPGETNGKE